MDKPQPKRSRAAGKTPKKGNPPPNWRQVFLGCLETTCNISASAKAARVSRETCYRHYRDDPEFAGAWDDALEAATDALEAVARKRAIEGSDVLLIFLLKANRPEKYRDNFPLHKLLDKLSADKAPVPAEAPR